jgi:hypothetical protein
MLGGSDGRSLIRRRRGSGIMLGGSDGRSLIRRRDSGEGVELYFNCAIPKPTSLVSCFASCSDLAGDGTCT